MDDFNLETTLKSMEKQGLIQKTWDKDQKAYVYNTTPLGIITLELKEKSK